MKPLDSLNKGLTPIKKFARFCEALQIHIAAFVRYCISGVWSDRRPILGVRIIKTINLTVSSFLNRGLQIKSMALTYSTVLALVPMIALLVAIGRGFGLQKSMQEELFRLFPAQEKAISTALTFVDSYLSSATSGVFVGVGIIVLLWTLVSLLSSIEDAFNSIWYVKETRSLYRKISDYIAICMMIPILMICQSGLSIFMSTVIQDNINLPYITPLLNRVLEMAPLFLSWLAFSLSFKLIPNIGVKFRYAAIAGAICAIAFQVIQLLFVNGQIYVSKYNAIYGSFAFLPLLLIWLQLSWMVLLSGCVLTYSLQNVFTFSYMGNSDIISDNAWHNAALVIAAVIAKRFSAGKKPLTEVQLATRYKIPVRLVNDIVCKLEKAKLVYFVKLDEDEFGISPAMQIEQFSVGDYFRVIDATGNNMAMPDFDLTYSELIAVITPLRKAAYANSSTILLRDLPIPEP